MLAIEVYLKHKVFVTRISICILIVNGPDFLIGPNHETLTLTGRFGPILRPHVIDKVFFLCNVEFSILNKAV